MVCGAIAQMALVFLGILKNQGKIQTFRTVANIFTTFTGEWKEKVSFQMCVYSSILTDIRYAHFSESGRQECFTVTGNTHQCRCATFLG